VVEKQKNKLQPMGRMGFLFYFFDVTAKVKHTKGMPNRESNQLQQSIVN
jgi:hypothetical protein